jgi:molybdenum cofactor cytidylyltransferase
VYAVILAAGAARRFDGEKLLEPLHGPPVLEHVIRAVHAAEHAGMVRASYVVVSREHGAVAALAEGLGARVVPARRAGDGMGWSLRAGLGVVERSSPLGAAALLVVLGDQPALRPDVIEALVRRWRATGAAVTRPRYQDEPSAPGHPVLLDRSMWSRVASLTGDAGLWPLTASELVDVAGSNPDIDTRADLRAFSWKEPS